MIETRTPLLWMGEDELRDYAHQLMDLLVLAWRREFDLIASNAQAFEDGYQFACSTAALSLTTGHGPADDARTSLH